MINLIYIIWGTMKIQMQNSFVRPMFKFCLIIGPIANTILLYYMFRNSQMDNFITYVIVGAGLSSLWECICFSSIGDINRERWSGTLSLIFSAPVGFNLIILGKIIGNTVLSLVSFLITILTALLLFGETLVIHNIWVLLASLLISLCAFIIISQVFAYLLTLSRKTTLYMNCLCIPIALVCGFVVPVESLPSWVHPLSYVLPPTWVVRLIRGSFDTGISSNEYFRYFAILTAQIIIYAILCQMLFKIIDRSIKIKASLELM